MKLLAGDWVEVRSKDEILKTLDENGRLEGLPFMPQMFAYCGQRFPVYKSAYKTCDTVSGDYGGRHVPETIHLDIRCDGRAYGGCQAGCLIFWKHAWLKPVSDGIPTAVRQDASGQHADSELWPAVRSEADGDDVRYSCQATELLNYTIPLRWWDARQYVEAYSSGNRTLPEIARGLCYLFYYYATLAFSDRWGRPSRWLYNKVNVVTGGLPFPRSKGTIPTGQPTPRQDLGLQPGDMVRVKSYDQILATVDTRLANRGLWFDAELVPFCGKVFRVNRRVERFVDEKTGRMRHMKTPAVILDDVTCQALFSGRRLFCPRGINLWWREIWLEPVSRPRPANAKPHERSSIQVGAHPTAGRRTVARAEF